MKENQRLKTDQYAQQFLMWIECVGLALVTVATFFHLHMSWFACGIQGLLG